MATQDLLAGPDLFSDDGGVPLHWGLGDPNWGLDNPGNWGLDNLDNWALDNQDNWGLDNLDNWALDNQDNWGLDDLLDRAILPDWANPAYMYDDQLRPTFVHDQPIAPAEDYWAQHPPSPTAGTYLTAWALNANLADLPFSEARKVLDSPQLALPAPARGNENLVGHQPTELQEQMWSWFPQERFASASRYLNLTPTSIKTGCVLDGFQHPAVQALNLQPNQYPDAAATQAVIAAKWANMGAGGRAKYGHKISAMFPDFAIIDEMVVQKMRLARHPEWSNDVLGLDPSKKFSLKNSFELDEEHERLFKSRCIGANKSARKDARSSSISSPSSPEGAITPRKGERQWVYLVPMEHSHAILLWAHGKDHRGRDSTFERIKTVFATDGFPKDVVAAWIIEMCPMCRAKHQRTAATKAANAAGKGNTKRKRGPEEDEERGDAQRPRL